LFIANSLENNHTHPGWRIARHEGVLLAMGMQSLKFSFAELTA